MDEQKYCRFCGSANPTRAAFCANCGKTFTSTSTSPPPAPPPSTSQGLSDYQTLNAPPSKPQRGSKKKTKVCKTCGRKIRWATTSFAASRAGQCNKCWKQGQQLHRKATPKTKIITETRCTCNACGKVWHYGKQEIAERRSAKEGNAAAGVLCCMGCLPAIFIPDKKVVDLDKCPNCGSKIIKKEQIEHEVAK